MKLKHIFALVVLLHFAVVGVLFVTPGCSGVGERIRPQGDRGSDASPFGEPPSQSAGGSVALPAGSVPPDASPESSPPLLPPTKPTWNIAGQETEVLEGEVVYEEVQLNAIDIEGEVVESIEVETVDVAEIPVLETYTVVSGDNLTRIAKAKGVSLGELMAANNLSKTSVLQIGQTLVIPSESLVGPMAPTSAITVESIDMEGKDYTVQKGDTLGAIARRYGTSVSSIRGANSLSSDTIYVGQDLLIPAGSIDVPASPPVVTKPVKTQAGEDTYVVKSGDTLGAISKRYGVTVRELAARNDISDPRKLRAGQTLIVPGSGSGSLSAPAPTPAPSLDVPAPVPAPSTPLNLEEVEETEVFDFSELENAPIVPIQSTEE